MMKKVLIHFRWNQSGFWNNLRFQLLVKCRLNLDDALIVLNLTYLIQTKTHLTDNSSHQILSARSQKIRDFVGQQDWDNGSNASVNIVHRSQTHQTPDKWQTCSGKMNQFISSMHILKCILWYCGNVNFLPTLAFTIFLEAPFSIHNYCKSVL